ncbi:MAG: hypothetical protein AAF485_32130, partial [Chloroflexota bacterium]
VLAYIANNESQKALQIGIPFIRQLGVKLSAKPGRGPVLRALIQVKLVLLGKAVDELATLPEMTNPQLLAASQLMSTIGPAAYITSAELFAELVLKYVHLTVTQGCLDESAGTFSAYGVILCGILNDIEQGYQFGQLGMNYLDRFPGNKIKPRATLVFNGLIRHWKEPYRTALEPLLEGYQFGLEIGDLEYSGLCIQNYCASAYFASLELNQLNSEFKHYGHILSRRLGQVSAHLLHRLYHQTILNLVEPVSNPWVLDGDAFREADLLPQFHETNNRNGLFNFYSCKMRLAYLFQNYSEATESAKKAEAFIDGGTSTIVVSNFYFYNALIHLAWFRQVSPQEQKKILKLVKVSQKKIKAWARHAPMNQLHRFYLIEAERYRISGNQGAAREAYDQAISLAQQHEFIDHEALAYELAGQFYLEIGSTHFANLCLQNARYRYQLWGATAKVQNLDIRYPNLLIQQEASQPKLFATTVTQSSTQRPTTRSSIRNQAANSLDLMSVIKASQAISGEIVQEKLLATLMKILIENAGAEKGYLIFEKVGSWSIEAMGTVEDGEILINRVETTTADTLPLTVINYVAR